MHFAFAATFSVPLFFLLLCFATSDAAASASSFRSFATSFSIFFIFYFFLLHFSFFCFVLFVSFCMRPIRVLHSAIVLNIPFTLLIPYKNVCENAWKQRLRYLQPRTHSNGFHNDFISIGFVLVNWLSTPSCPSSVPRIHMPMDGRICFIVTAIVMIACSALLHGMVLLSVSLCHHTRSSLFLFLSLSLFFSISLSLSHFFDESPSNK